MTASIMTEARSSFDLRRPVVGDVKDLIQTLAMVSSPTNVELKSHSLGPINYTCNLLKMEASISKFQMAGAELDWTGLDHGTGKSVDHVWPIEASP